MIQKLKTLILSLSILFVPMAMVAVPATVSATTANPNNIQSGVRNGVGQATTGTQNQTCANVAGDASTSVNSTITSIINLLSIAVGVVAVIMIIIGGFRYITSGGKQESVSGAKNTILYGIIGLIIVALAQVIVQFVLNKSTSI